MRVDTPAVPSATTLATRADAHAAWVGGRIAAAAVWGISFAYFVFFRAYGFQVEDEGTLLFWLTRVAAGQFPYVDFHTGYTPGYFYLGARLLELARNDANVLRVFIAAVNATSAAALYALGFKLADRRYALIAPALWVAFLPVYPGEFASFNIPYPAWFATLAWLGLVLALVRFVDEGRILALVLAGVAAAVAFAMKPNAGAFAIAAATWTVVIATRTAGLVDRIAALVAVLVMALGVWFAFGLSVWGTDAVVHLLPLALIVVLVAGRLRGRYARPGAIRAWVGLAALGASFVLPTLAWVIPVLGRLGNARFAKDVLLIGSDAAALYHQEHPAPEPYAAAIVVGVVGFAVGGYLVRRRTVSPMPLVALVRLAQLRRWSRFASRGSCRKRRGSPFRSNSKTPRTGSPRS